MLFDQNRTLSIAVAASVLLHGGLLAVRFAAPDTFQFKPVDPGLEVILVNAKHDRKPLKADALAQANLDGGGNAEAGRATSPLPDMRRSEDGEAMRALQRRIEELEKQQRMLTQLNKKARFKSAPIKDQHKPEAQARPDGTDMTDSAREIMRREAEIAKRIEDENKRPKKTFISPSTREVGYAMYYDSVRRRIEQIGTLNFPQKDGKPLYGKVMMISISVFQDGKLYSADGDNGITIDRPSGNPALDEAAKRIIRRSAPFGVFPQNMRSSRGDVWVMTALFDFTREGLQATMREGLN